MFHFSTYHTGVQRINNVFHIVGKVENVCVNKYIFDLIDNVEYVVYALYSSIATYFLKILGSNINMLVGIAGECLAPSVRESVSGKCEQCALGLQKLAPNRQHARQSQIKILGELTKRPGKSRPIIQNLRGIGICGRF